ncbi:MAG TPA: hypothetical protein PKA06_00175 [Gemmatales bacterium]|nr:hypothetical protein [Gemmatales bacterium]
MTDLEFLEMFHAGNLPREAWTHEAHIRLAYLELKSNTFSEALKRVRRGIQLYNSAVLNKPDAYHETITVAYLQLIKNAMLQGVENFSQLRLYHPALFDRKLSALYRYYTQDRLMNNESRVRFVEPDIIPLPQITT